MPSFSQRSRSRLLTCHEDLQLICSSIIRITDFSVLCGHRDEQEQNEAYNNGYSRLLYPNSKHNQYPSMAVDLAPYPIDWDDIDRFRMLAQVFLFEASLRNIRIVWGGWWDPFKDYPHFQLG